MTADSHLTLRAEALTEGRGWRLLSPAVGVYAQAPRLGSTFRAGETCAVLEILDRPIPLVIPEGCGGMVATPPPERKRLPVGCGEMLLELHPVNAAAGDPALDHAADAVDPEQGFVFRAPQAGRFYRSPEPEAPPFVEAGDLLHAGRTLGLLEVMKTFTPIKYAATDGLPEQARIESFLCADGADVEENQALIRLAAESEVSDG